MYCPVHLSAHNWSPSATATGRELLQLLQPGQTSLGDLPDLIKALDHTIYPAQRWFAWNAKLEALILKGQGAEAARVYREEVLPNMVTDHLADAAGMYGGCASAEVGTAIEMISVEVGSSGLMGGSQRGW